MGARKLETWPIFILHKILMVSLADPGRQRAESLLKGQWRRERGRGGERGATRAGQVPGAVLELQPTPCRGGLRPRVGFSPPLWGSVSSSVASKERI